MKEEWRSIIGYEGLYEVSNQGRVKSLARMWRNGKRHEEKMFYTIPDAHYYEVFTQEQFKRICYL